MANDFHLQSGVQPHVGRVLTHRLGTETQSQPEVQERLELLLPKKHQHESQPTNTVCDSVA